MEIRKKYKPVFYYKQSIDTGSGCYSLKEAEDIILERAIRAEYDRAAPFDTAEVKVIYEKFDPREEY